MASSCANLPSYFPSLPKNTHSPPPFNFLCNGVPLHREPMPKLHAKFDKFQDQEYLDDGSTSANLDPQAQQEMLQEQAEEDDSCLPSSLDGAVRQSGEATAAFVSSGGLRAIILHYALGGAPNPTAALSRYRGSELWELSRVFLDTLIEETGCQRVKAVFPDAGAAALLKYRWNDAAFEFASLGDRKPVTKEDEIVVMLVPDYQMLKYVEQIGSELSDAPPRPLIMWNPRLVSEDVGVGINARRLRKNFLRTFSVVYSMRPLPSGAVFRNYPGLWKVFYDDKDRPNRYVLAKELVSKPDAEELEIIFGGGEQNQEKGSSFFDQASGIFSSMNRFLRAISR